MAIDLGRIEELDASGVLEPTRALVHDPERRRRLGRRGREVVDGRGGDRVVSEMREMTCASS